MLINSIPPFRMRRNHSRFYSYIFSICTLGKKFKKYGTATKYNTTDYGFSSQMIPMLLVLVYHASDSHVVLVFENY